MEQPDPQTIAARWVVNEAYDWAHIQSLRVLAGHMLADDGRDDATHTLAQAVLDLTDELTRKEHRIIKALSSRRQESDQ